MSTLSLTTRVVNRRAVPSNGLSHVTCAWVAPVRLALAGITTGGFSVALNVTSPPSCTPWLHRHYPASSLLWVL